MFLDEGFQHFPPTCPIDFVGLEFMLLTNITHPERVEFDGLIGFREATPGASFHSHLVPISRIKAWFPFGEGQLRDFS